MTIIFLHFQENNTCVLLIIGGYLRCHFQRHFSRKTSHWYTLIKVNVKRKLFFELQNNLFNAIEILVRVENIMSSQLSLYHDDIWIWLLQNKPSEFVLVWNMARTKFISSIHCSFHNVGWNGNSYGTRSQFSYKHITSHSNNHIKIELLMNIWNIFFKYVYLYEAWTYGSFMDDVLPCIPTQLSITAVAAKYIVFAVYKETVQLNNIFFL